MGVRQFSLFATVLATLHLRAVHCALEASVWAPWPSYDHSLLLETSEFLADEDVTRRVFWSFVDATVGNASGVIASDSGSRAFLAAKGLLPALTFDVLRLAIAARAYSPHVELHRQLALASKGYATCNAVAAEQPHAATPAWADLSTGRVACSADELLAAIAADAPADGGASISTYALDHWYPAATPAKALEAESRPLVVLYARIGSPAFAAMHAVAAEAAADGRVRYILRHYPGAAGKHDVSSSVYVPWLCLV
jgi:hypothetical protein